MLKLKFYFAIFWLCGFSHWNPTWAQEEGTTNNKEKQLVWRGVLGGGVDAQLSGFILCRVQLAGARWYGNWEMAYAVPQAKGVRFADGRSATSYHHLFTTGLSGGREWRSAKKLIHFGVGGGVAQFGKAYHMNEGVLLFGSLTPWDMPVHRYYTLPYLLAEADILLMIGRRVGIGLVTRALWTPEIDQVSFGVVLSAGRAGK